MLAIHEERWNPSSYSWPKHAYHREVLRVVILDTPNAQRMAHNEQEKLA